MDKKEQYEKFSLQELIQMVESQDYTQAAREAAIGEIESRKLSPDALEELSKEYFYSFFEKQLRGTLLASMNEAEFPKSEYLSEVQLMKIVERVYRDLKSKRKDFYRNLPS